MRLLVSVVVTLAVFACTGGGDTTGTSSGASTADGGGGSSSSSSTSSSSSSSSSSSGGASSGASSGGGCTGTMTVLVKYGESSSCGHPIPAGVDLDNLNVYFSPGGGVLEKVCRTDRTSCEKWQGWFFVGEEIGFCDATCAKIDSGPDAAFLVETGCPTTWCF